MADLALRRVAVITGTRADYGLLRPTMSALQADARFELQVVACAMHLSPAFGQTIDAIEADGFNIAARVDTSPEDADAGAIGRRIAQGVAGFTEAFAELSPDVIVVLGDRYEMLAAALGAAALQIPVAHIHGGELSEGSLDDAMRHCITKLSHLHFASTRLYGERICQLGEQPDRVHVVGAAAIESIEALELLDEAALAADLGELTHPIAVVTLHPESLDPDSARADAEAVVSALEATIPGGTVVVTLPNDDPGTAATREVLAAYADRSANAVAFESLGQLRYLSLLAVADIMIGNSSSGLIEAPSFQLPTVNVGHRQDGRVTPDNVVSCDATSPAVTRAIGQTLAPAFRAGLDGLVNPYRGGAVSERVVAVLADVTDPAALRRKRFLDLPDGAWRAPLELAP